jgi:hypothetical protein
MMFYSMRKKKSKDIYMLAWINLSSSSLSLYSSSQSSLSKHRFRGIGNTKIEKHYGNVKKTFFLRNMIFFYTFLLTLKLMNVRWYVDVDNYDQLSTFEMRIRKHTCENFFYLRLHTILRSWQLNVPNTYLETTLVTNKLNKKGKRALKHKQNLAIQFSNPLGNLPTPRTNPSWKNMMS